MDVPDLNAAPEPPAEWIAQFADGSATSSHDIAEASWRCGWVMCFQHVMEAHAEEGPPDPLGMLAANTISQHELFTSYLSAGFDPGQALHLLGLSVVAAIIKP